MALRIHRRLRTLTAVPQNRLPARVIVNPLTRRDLLHLSALAAASRGSSNENPREVALLMRVSNGAIVSGNSSLARDWTLPPGSTCKPFTIQALLHARRLQLADTFLCPGELRLGHRNLTCSHPRGLPPLDASQIIAYSCNCATAHFAQRLGAEELAASLRQYGFQIINAGDVRLMGLGEEGVLITPLVLANAYRLLSGSADPAVRQGLEDAVRYGTAQGAAVSGLRIAGKTGTVITASGLHAALFAGFEPSRAPSHVAVVVTQGNSGGADAAPMAAELFRRAQSSQGSRYRVRFGQSIVELGVEEYVAAVLVGEASVFEQPEALKAMAVAARTYAAHQKGRHAAERFDFCNTTHCQRAEPEGATVKLTRAVQATEGELLRLHNVPAFTPYSMCCGGRTEDGASVWPELKAPYLTARSDPYCQADLWNSDLSFADVERALKAAGLRCPDGLRHILITEHTDSGRARRLLLHGSGSDLAISASVFRFAVGRRLGWNLVRSDYFTISSLTGSELQIHGRGMGHGVGLCQRGAESMAFKGFSYREILAFYYPGTSTNNWTRMGGDHVVVFVTDPIRERSVLIEAEQIARQLPLPLTGETEIWVHPNLAEFRDTTHEPGWVAARTEGRRIDLQPLPILERKQVLAGTLQHELMHVAIETRAVGGLPIWFREGLVEHLCNRDRHRPTRLTAPSDGNLRQRSTERQAAEAYRQAGQKVGNLVARYGEPAVLSWVTQGLPAEVRNSIVNTDPANNR